MQNQNAVSGLMPRLFMRVLRAALYLLILIQYIVLLVLLRKMNQLHSLSFRAWLLPVLYLGPLIFGLVFRRHIRTLLSQELLSVKAASICDDWITILLGSVYGMLLEFRLLH